MGFSLYPITRPSIESRECIDNDAILKFDPNPNQSIVMIQSNVATLREINF